MQAQHRAFNLIIKLISFLGLIAPEVLLKVKQGEVEENFLKGKTKKKQASPCHRQIRSFQNKYIHKTIF